MRLVQSFWIDWEFAKGWQILKWRHVTSALVWMAVARDDKQEGEMYNTPVDATYMTI